MVHFTSSLLDLISSLPLHGELSGFLRRLSVTPVSDSLWRSWDALSGALHSTKIAFTLWIDALLSLATVIVHLFLVCSPYVSPAMKAFYSRIAQFWEDLSLGSRITLLIVLAWITAAIWLRQHWIRNNYATRLSSFVSNVSDRITQRYLRLLDWITHQSRMAALAFPHCLWFSLFILVLCFVNLIVLTSLIDSLTFVLGLVFPTIRTHYALRHRPSISRFWLKFWVCRAILHILFEICLYLLLWLLPLISLLWNESEIRQFLRLSHLWLLLWLYLPPMFGASPLSRLLLKIAVSEDRNLSHSPSIAPPSQSITNVSSLASLISLDSLQRSINGILTLLRPWLSESTFTLIRNGCWQIVIFMVFSLTWPTLGYHLLSFVLASDASLKCVSRYQSAKQRREQCSLELLHRRDNPMRLRRSQSSSLLLSSPSRQTTLKDCDDSDNHDELTAPMSQDDSAVSVSASSSSVSRTQSVSVDESSFSMHNLGVAGAKLFGRLMGKVKSLGSMSNADDSRGIESEMESLEEMMRESQELIVFWLECWVVSSWFHCVVYQMLSQSALIYIPLLRSMLMIPPLWFQISQFSGNESDMNQTRLFPFSFGTHWVYERITLILDIPLHQKQD